MENKMAIIALENIRKSYADGSQMHHVLNQLNLSVEPNEFVAILGPSGSGKSTLLAIAGLLLSADSHRRPRLDRSQPRPVDAKTARIARLYLSRPPAPLLYENRWPVRTGGQIKRGKDKKKCQEEVKALLADLGIEACYHQYPNQMSGGQKQRAAIARAFIGNPQVILADEPTASLDPDRGQEIAQLIRKEVKSKNKSAIMVTHDRSILTYVDTIYELKHGQLLKVEKVD